jgi:hypothetical protein
VCSEKPTPAIFFEPAFFQIIHYSSSTLRRSTSCVERAKKAPPAERGSRQQAADEVLWLRAEASSLNVTA